MEETTYRGYKIRIHKTDKWFSVITRPGDVIAMREPVTAPISENKDDFMRRVKERIDREEDSES